MLIAICDDSRTHAEHIQNLIQANIDTNRLKVNLYLTGTELVNAIKRGNKYHIIFLDIEMPEMDGVVTAKKIKEYLPNAVIIFVTSYFQYITAALETDPFQFLLKPVKEDDLVKQLKRAIQYLANRAFAIKLTYKGQEDLVRADEIIFMESYGKYLIVHAKDQVYKVMERISHMQEILEPHGFFRIHRCILLNMHFIQRIQNDMVYCSTGDKLILSKKNRKSLMKAYGQYILGDGDRRD